MAVHSATMRPLGGLMGLWGATDGFLPVADRLEGFRVFVLDLGGVVYTLAVRAHFLGGALSGFARVLTLKVPNCLGTFRRSARGSFLPTFAHPLERVLLFKRQKQDSTRGSLALSQVPPPHILIDNELEHRQVVRMDDLRAR